MPGVRNLRDGLPGRRQLSWRFRGDASDWDREGKIAAHRNPANGYHLFRRADLEAFLKGIVRSGRQRGTHRRGVVA
jgi:hypothetical protein